VTKKHTNHFCFHQSNR